MNKREKRMNQKFCDVSNWLRMHKPRTGRQNTEAAFELADEIMAMISRLGSGGDATAQTLAALAIVRQYYRKAIGLTCSMNADALIRQYEELFDSDFWMEFHHDMLLNITERCIMGEDVLFKKSYHVNLENDVCRCLENLDSITKEYESIKSYDEAVRYVAYYLEVQFSFRLSEKGNYVERLAIAWYHANKEFGFPLEEDSYNKFIGLLRVDVIKKMMKFNKNQKGMKEWYKTNIK